MTYGYAVHCGTTNNNCTIVYLKNSNGNGGAQFSNISISNNSWHHIAFAWDGSKVTFYLDGASKGTSSFSGALVHNTLPLTIGMDSAGSTEYFGGKIDEVRIFNRALTQSDITELLGGGGGCSPSLSIGTASSPAGSTNVSLNTSISYSGSSCVTQSQFDISYNSSYLTLSSVETGSASSSAGKSCSYNILGTGSARIICAGSNANLIGAGELVRLQWSISGSAPNQSTQAVGCSNALGTDANSATFSISCSSGSIYIGSGNCCDLTNDGNVNVGDLQTLVNVILGKQTCPK
jgi:hypothetical protein